MDKTYHAKVGEVLADWHLYDAENAVLGRMAARIALVLQGKHKGQYTPNVDTGDFVIVTNAEKGAMTGDKWNARMHRYHTGYIGGLREVSAAEIRTKRPERIIELAVRTHDAPETRLGRAMFKKLKVYAGTEHRHEAQQPTAVDMTPFLLKDA